MDRSARSTLAVLSFTAAIGALLVWSWVNRSSGLLTPARGTGYWLGISGAVIMLIVLLYPLRKRVRLVRSWGRIAAWFRWHMIFGIVGPVLIVMHSNFSYRSTNALVAFVSMLVVVASGIVGRYLYARIHRGLYGAKVETRDLTVEAAELVQSIDAEIPVDRKWVAALSELEKEALVPSHSLASAVVRAVRLRRRSREARQMLLTGLDEAAPHIAAARGWSAAELQAHRRHCLALARRFGRAIRRASTLAAYERVFALWHVLHLPLIALLVVTALIHIVAVNLY